MSVTSLESSVPAELAPDQYTAIPVADPASGQPGIDYTKVGSYVQTWWRNIHSQRDSKRRIWDDCWALYRGIEDFSDKEDWQSRIVLPKANAAVKQASSVMIRLLTQSGTPWRYEPADPNNTALQIKAEKKTKLTSTFMKNAKYLTHIKEALEGGFITGLVILKPSWGYESKLNLQVQPDGQIIQNEIMEGNLHMRAVDPYNFYWMPGSKLNAWTGTIEQMEVPIWEIKKLVKSFQDAGLGPLINQKAIANIKPSHINAYDKMSSLRMNDLSSNTKAANESSDTCKVTEYYGPIFQGEDLVAEHGHVLMIGDDVLIVKKNTFWSGKAPYIAWSPLIVPFRTEGTGLIESVRDVLRQYSKITNQAVDNVAYSMLPIFELFEDAYENPEDFETGLTPGKVLRRKQLAQSLPGINPVAFPDISGGSIQVAAQLDRAWQEGALVGEIQQAIPRFRGAQSAAEVEIKDQNQQGFFGAMASDMEENLLEPLVDFCGDLIMQFMDTTSDPRIAQILGADYTVFAGMTHAQKLNEVNGDFTLRVTGISEQFEKQEMLSNLVQFMNLIGQNPMAWLPYINQIELLKRIVEGFRPTIHDIDKIVVTPEVAQYNMQQQQLKEMAPNMLAMLPQFIEMAQAQALAKEQNAQARSNSTVG